ncbi:GNAT family N-acetyltransferase [Demequina aurantiaca]|uniref:GNAT family N-acetyltransferase n=1 Tax=Demequina aurantiaca TaxID=676200 RepID=UPI003D325688
MNFADTPVLAGPTVRLEPLAPSHAGDLSDSVAVGDLWRTWSTSIPAPEAMANEIQSRLGKQRDGTMAPWAVVDARTGRAVGMTTYMNIDEPNLRLEIGSTWLGRDAQGTGINPAMKLLLLSRAFDDLSCNAVEFRTHWHNLQSRAAIARLGAKQDGVLRNHKVWHDGTLRDTVVFSIIASEWPAARAALAARVQRHR